MSRDPNDLAILCHELRSPVAALVAIAEAYPGAPAERRRRLVELAAAAVGGIERLLTEAAIDVLRIERLDAGRLAREAAETATLASGIAVAARGEAGLSIDGDPERLRQALANLIGNAIGHSRAGAGVIVRASREGTAIVLAVTDEGDGIPAADLSRVFERGVRLTADRPGSGVGLAVVRAIARAHGGEVEVESTVGQGSTFRLVLPDASAAP